MSIYCHRTPPPFEENKEIYIEAWVRLVNSHVTVAKYAGAATIYLQRKLQPIKYTYWRTFPELLRELLLVAFKMNFLQF